MAAPRTICLALTRDGKWVYDETTLLNIADAARLAAGFVQGLSKADFLDDFKTQSAVLYHV